MNGEQTNTSEARTTERQLYTPGPWSNERIWDTPASRIHARIDGVPVALAEVFTMYSAGEKEANARLIAAAPDLLALLKELIDIEGPQPGHVEWARKVQAAIAKAEGRS